MVRGARAAPMSAAKVSEVEVAASVVAYLRENCWDVYQEVVVPHAGTVDLVALAGPIVWAIEVKVRFGLRVVDDALRWIGWAHRVSIAHLRRVEGGSCRVEGLLLRASGVGRLSVRNGPLAWGDAVAETDRPRWIRHPKRRRFSRTLGHPDRLREMCVPEGRDYCQAGSQNAKRWTPFRRTADHLIAWVRKNPGRPMREAVEALRDVHHYATDDSARSCLLGLVRAGVLEGIKVVPVCSIYNRNGRTDLPPRCRVVLVPDD